MPHLPPNTHHCKKHLVKWPWVNVSAVSGSINRRLKKSKTQLSSINPLTIHHASRDTFLLANKYHPSAGNYTVLNWIIAMTKYRLTYWEVSVLALWSLMELWGGWWMIIVFWNFFNHTTNLFNEPWNCSNHALVVILTKYFLQCGDALHEGHNHNSTSKNYRTIQQCRHPFYTQELHSRLCWITGISSNR